MWVSKFDYFSKFWLLFQYIMTTKISELIYLALQHYLQNLNTKFQYWDMSYQMILYILAHVPYFCRPSHIYFIPHHNDRFVLFINIVLVLCKPAIIVICWSAVTAMHHVMLTRSTPSLQCFTGYLLVQFIDGTMHVDHWYCKDKAFSTNEFTL